MFMRKIFILIILSATIALAGCGSPTNKAAVTGVITHTHPMTLPVGYVVTVQIDDTTKADAPGKKIAEQVIMSFPCHLRLSMIQEKSTRTILTAYV
jgi:uncharacterized lipoprotein YbaY